MIDYLYGSMIGIHENIQEKRPSLVYWEVIQLIVASMKRIVGSIVLNQCFIKEWLLSDVILDLVCIYTYCSGDDANEDVYKHLDAMVEEKGYLQAAENLHRNLP